MDTCIFCKIRDKEIPKEFTYEDEDIMVFPDINPKKPIHLLIVPKEHIVEFAKLTDDVLLSKIRKIIQQMITTSKLSDAGYQVTVNGGGLQDIDHLHFHLKGPWLEREV